MIDKYIFGFLDDVLVYSDSATKHEEHLRSLLQWLRELKLYAKTRKYKVGKSEVKHFGHLVGSGIL